MLKDLTFLNELSQKNLKNIETYIYIYIYIYIYKIILNQLILIYQENKKNNFNKLD